MTLSLQDRRLRRAHRDFTRAADAIAPLMLLVGLLRATVALCRTALAAARTADPIALRPRILRD